MFGLGMLQVKPIYVLKLINFVYLLFELTMWWAGTGLGILQELSEWCAFVHFLEAVLGPHVLNLWC
jgi:hypothetical protein